MEHPTTGHQQALTRIEELEHELRALRALVAVSAVALTDVAKGLALSRVARLVDDARADELVLSAQYELEATLRAMAVVR